MVTDILVQSKLSIDIDCFCIDRTKGDDPKADKAGTNYTKMSPNSLQN